MFIAATATELFRCSYVALFHLLATSTELQRQPNKIISHHKPVSPAVYGVWIFLCSSFSFAGDGNRAAKKTGSCHAGGMNCAEALLHSFRILEQDCGPGVGVSKGFGAFIIWPIFRFSKHHLC
ncbi:hypothetical protein HanXRQr2_Chr16g0724801 [Helianthus annuus]|uniref:Uncharacterized protein n=1 Tax=Helianthus annuus TaxID=4232 RepID=A0A9K3GWZ2_HELAN|nr:hypothetical protein HanXRQr2_Chr16g0724801 [Helianthus annuus]